MSSAPVAGRHYPTSVGEFRSWFSTDADCLDYLEWMRWPDGFVCPECADEGGWRLGDGRFRCAACRSCTSVTAGTVFDKTRTPMTVWFTACWLFATQKGRDLSAELAARPRHQLVSDRLGDASPAATGVDPAWA